ncbi:MAG: hypothetical protein ABSC03_15120 [Verrucomicrobiota bacterium]|jgi:hypothetical protein
MSTYQLTWNPRRSPEEGLRVVVSKLARGKRAEGHWSCGNNKSIQPGDRAFLLRQGSDHPGIVGSGWITRGSFQAQHWDETKRRQGRLAWFVMVEWDAMVLAENALSRADLLGGILPTRLLKAAASGAIIDGQFTERLERDWAAHRNVSLTVAPLVLAAISALEGEPIEYRGYRRKRDHKLKRAALDAAQGVCVVCGVDFSKILNGRGVRVLQVHHKKQLGQQDAPRINTLDDLAVVCANCHALIHLDTKKALTIEALKLLLSEAR